MTDFFDDSDLPVTQTFLGGCRACAYCGEVAEYLVWLDDLVGFCCSEPTHWTWLVEAVLDEAAHDRRDG